MYCFPTVNRLNKFCQERLLIGLENDDTNNRPRTDNEVWNNVMSQQKGEPHAEARVASEPSAHHLTILSQPSVADAKNKSQSSTNNQRKGQRVRKLPSVYSQDFRILKILPHNLDNINDIDDVSNKIQLKTDHTSAVDVDVPFNAPSMTASTSTSTIASTTEAKDDNQILDDHIENNLDYPSSISSNQRENVRIDDEIETELENMMVETALPTVDELPLYTAAAPTGGADLQTDPQIIGMSYPQHEPSSSSVEVFDAVGMTPVDGNNEINEDYQIVETDDDDGADESVHIVAVPPKIAQLDHGFLATAGYPKFYIGESNCSWKLIAPHGHQIRITILDINLRCKHI